jgi:hypothetical protein
MSNKTTIKSKMQQAKVVLANAQEPELKAALAEFGYDDAALAEGQTLYDDAKALIKEQKKAYANQYKATRILNNTADDAKKYYLRLVKISKLALEGDEDSIKDLGISGQRKETYDGWTNEALTFFSTALASPDILAVLEPKGITVDSLTAGLQMVEDLDPLYTDQKNKIGLAQVATDSKTKKMDELFAWINKVIQYSRIAFEDDPQQLERFDVTVYSEGYSPKSGSADTSEEPGDIIDPPTENPPATTKSKKK